MFLWNEKHVFNATGGKITGKWCSANISTDTRQIKKGDLFIAIKGKNFDGHNFLYEAFRKGAVAAIVNDDKGCKDFPMIVVDDTLKALQNMASYYIKNILVKTKVISITGSIGKTTTKDMLHTVLSQYGISYSTIGNLNNNIGVPLTVLSAPQNCEYLILEMGMSRSGEIRELSKISTPDIAIITNIEHAHTENFSSLVDIAQAKLEILHGMKSDGVLILNKDSKCYEYLFSYSDKRIINFGKSKDAMVHLLGFTNKQDGVNVKIKLSDNRIMHYDLYTKDQRYFYSVLAVVAIAESLKLTLPSNTFKNFKIPEGRGNVCNIKYKNKHIHLIDDSYNASPVSMKAAIEVLGTYFYSRKIALLGDMLELGSESVKFHMALLHTILKYQINKVYTVGDLMLELYKLLPHEIKGIHFTSSVQLKGHFYDIIQHNDTVLIKGSRGMKMNIILEDKVIISDS